MFPESSVQQIPRPRPCSDFYAGNLRHQALGIALLCDLSDPAQICLPDSGSKSEPQVSYPGEGPA